ncbi:MAG: extracellular solute-binding protein [Anaerolineaceae bacterium]|nr:extracellular solute-binding protein [Anaerolineaceae bacterium]
MKRINKKNTYFFLLLIIGSMVLSGCTKPGNEIVPTRTPNIGEISLSETKQAEETQIITQTHVPTQDSFMNIDLNLLYGTEIKFIYPWTGKIDLTLQALINEFNKQNEWGIIMTGISIGGAEPMFELLNEQSLAGDMPDLIILNPYLIKRLEGENYWTDLSNYINDQVWGLGQDRLAEIPEVYFKQSQVGSNIYGFPVSLSATGLFYNITWAQEMGFKSPPETQEELVEQLCKAAESKLSDDDIDNNGTGGMLLSRTPLSILSWYQSFGGNIPDGVETTQFNDQSGSSAFSFVKSLFDDSCAWVGRQPTPYDYFANRYTLIYEGKLEDILLQTDAFSRNQNTDEWIMLPYPTQSGQGSFVVDAYSLAVPVSKPETQLAAWLFIRWFTSNATQIIFIQSSGSWPVYQPTMKSMVDFQTSYPQWDDLIPFSGLVSAAPSYSGWLLDKMVLEDAYWRYLQADADTLPDILELLDATILELSEE